MGVVVSVGVVVGFVVGFVVSVCVLVAELVGPVAVSAWPAFVKAACVAGSAVGVHLSDLGLSELACRGGGRGG